MYMSDRSPVLLRGAMPVRSTHAYNSAGPTQVRLFVRSQLRHGDVARAKTSDDLAVAAVSLFLLSRAPLSGYELCVQTREKQERAFNK